MAERALAGGDLARAVAAIETLHRAPAAAEPLADWLRKARERLAVEAALHRLEALLTARLGDTAGTDHTGLARLMRILLALILLAAAVAAGVYFADNPGQVEIAWQGWLIDTSVGVLVAAAALLAFLVSVLALLVTGLRRIAGRRPPLAPGTPPAGRRGRADPGPRRARGGRCGAKPGGMPSGRGCCSARRRSCCCSRPRRHRVRAIMRRRGAPMPRCSIGATPSFSGCAG